MNRNATRTEVLFYLHRASSILIRGKGGEHCDKGLELQSLIDVKLKRDSKYEFSDSRKEINLIALFGILLYFVYYFLCRFKDFHYHNGKDFFFSKMKRCEYLSFK